jgi:nucleoid DNA-binding protein
MNKNEIKDLLSKYYNGKNENEELLKQIIDLIYEDIESNSLNEKEEVKIND